MPEPGPRPAVPTIKPARASFLWRSYKASGVVVVLRADAGIASAKTARDSLVANQRAWVGPRNAKSEKAPELEKDLPLIVEYQNTGREPALETIFDVDVFTATEEEDQGGQVARKVNEFVNQCKIKWTPLHATVVFPSSVGVGSAGYTMSRTVPAEMIDQDVVDGQKAIVVSGCFVYKTAIHHSSFCYFFKTKKTQPANWGICQVGNDAD
jgi:hypothetical protein